MLLEPRRYNLIMMGLGSSVGTPPGGKVKTSLTFYFHNVVGRFIQGNARRIPAVRPIHLAPPKMHVRAKIREPLQSLSAQLCRGCQAYAHACQTLFVGPSLRCEWSIRNGAELNGSVYESVVKKPFLRWI